MNATRLGIKNIMLIWTGLIILRLVLNIAGGALAGANAPAYP